MDKLAFKSRISINVTNNSFYQIYQRKLHENFLKYDGSNLFKEIAIGFNHGTQMTSEYPASVYDCLFV